jgi:hypothetical protein
MEAPRSQPTCFSVVQIPATHSLSNYGAIAKVKPSFKYHKPSYVMASDIHDYQKRLQHALDLVRNAGDISDQDKKLIEEFSTTLGAQRLNTGRVAKYVFHLKKSSETLNQLNRSDRGLSNATKEDISTFNIWLGESSVYTPHTKRDYVTTLKRFFQWLKAPP